MLGLGVCMAAMPAASGAASKKKRVGPCSSLPINIKLSSHDPTGLLEDGYAWIYLNPKGCGPDSGGPGGAGQQDLCPGPHRRQPGTGSHDPGRGCMSPPHDRRQVPGQVTAGKPGRGNRRVTRPRSGSFTDRPSDSRRSRSAPGSVTTSAWSGSPCGRFAAPRSAGPGSPDRPRRRRGQPAGDQVDRQQAGSGRTPIQNKLKPARYRVRLTGQDLASGIFRASSQTWRFGRAAAVPSRSRPPPADPEGRGRLDQRTVGWPPGRGFIAPGIGYGEVVCNPPYQQWVRFYPSDTSRESAMMTWTYKNWDFGKGWEKSVREAKVHRRNRPRLP